MRAADPRPAPARPAAPLSSRPVTAACAVRPMRPGHERRAARAALVPLMRAPIEPIVIVRGGHRFLAAEARR